MSGWIKAHRAMLENPIVLKDSDHLAVWMWLLMTAAHEDRDVWFSGCRTTIKAGQLVTRRRKIAEALKISESKVQRILTLFEEENQIEQKTTNRNRLITIVSWLEYQGNDEKTDREKVDKSTKLGTKNAKTSQKRYAKNGQQKHNKQTANDHSISHHKKALYVAENENDKIITNGHKIDDAKDTKATQTNTNQTTTEQQVNTIQEIKNIRNKEERVTRTRTHARGSHFRAPSLQEVKDYIKQENCKINGEVFWWYYESRDWCIGNRKMNNWRKTIKTWEARDNSAVPSSKRRLASASEQYQYDQHIHNHINDLWR